MSEKKIFAKNLRIKILKFRVFRKSPYIEKFAKNSDKFVDFGNFWNSQIFTKHK